MEMTRRGFLRVTAGAALATAGGCCTSAPAPACFAVNGVRVGVQMWSINDIWKDNPAEAFRRLKALGYDGVQSFAFYAMNWDELEKMLKGEGLRIIDMPFYMKTLKEDEGKFLAFCARFGIDFAYEPYIKCVTKADWQAHAQVLLDVARRFAAKGIRVGYHNHQHESTERLDGARPIDILYAAGLNFELDVGHLALAGDDPVAWLKKLPNRVPSIHAKPSGDGPLGGVNDKNDWRGIFAAAAQAGTKWAIVECEARRNTYADVTASAAYLKGLRA